MGCPHDANTRAILESRWVDGVTSSALFYFEGGFSRTPVVHSVSNECGMLYVDPRTNSHTNTNAAYCVSWRFASFETYPREAEPPLELLATRCVIGWCWWRQRPMDACAIEGHLSCRRGRTPHLIPGAAHGRWRGLARRATDRRSRDRRPGLVISWAE